ncbi:MAG TPA: DNA gyrase inhibitor YacG [Bradyrhizobium sp.]|uniref:DNA gyrase inhibitor YacG n=1 Tax=Bradyrhizobium sp. TaxID=376 RepID=UPI002D80D373|nr:DNA gyrase inhibitor YacG [Bradyrhizobium sp.]HET7885732.1 DNA gyrase inhibitor YacG [Bradyrhizobium sp.]
MPAKPRGEGASGATGAKPCPICGKPASQENNPFCSQRCRDVDLNRWLSGSYVIPGRPDEDDDND